MNIFNAKDRLRRTDYFFQQVISLLLLFNVVFIFAVLGENEEDATLSFVYSLVTILSAVVYVVFDVISTIRRFHDLNKKGTWLFALFIPLYNIVLALGLLFERGTDGINFYGPDPRTFVKDTFKRGILINIGLVFLLGYSIYSVSSFEKERRKDMTAEIISHPAVSDFFVYENGDSTEYKYNIFKIVQVKGDSLVVMTGNYSFRSESEASKAMDESEFSIKDIWGETETISKDVLGYINISRAKRKNEKDSKISYVGNGVKE